VPGSAAAGLSRLTCLPQPGELVYDFAGLERQEDIQDLVAVPRLLNIGDLAASAVTDAGFRNLLAGNRVVGGDVFRTDNAGYNQLSDFEVHPDFLAALQ
jgi:hypothetical protein